jgi:hypothetical protein
MKRVLAIWIALALTGAACGKNNNSTTSPSTTTKTESFTGTVEVGGSGMSTFSVTMSGQVTVTLTSAGPPSTIAEGLGVGTPANSACGILPGGSVTVAAGSSAQLSGVVSPGTYCVTVYDVGNQTAPITYAVTVVHS